MVDQLNMWRARDLTIRGKVTLAKVFGATNLLYSMNALSVSPCDIREARAHLFKFLWNGKKSHIKSNTLIGDLNTGGLRMVDIELQNKAFKLAWAIRLMKTNQTWGAIPIGLVD